MSSRGQVRPRCEDRTGARSPEPAERLLSRLDRPVEHELSIDHDDPRTTTVRLRDWVPPRRVALAWHHDQCSPLALQAFVAAVRGAVLSRRSGVRSAA
jgi:hypothetical protein